MWCYLALTLDSSTLITVPHDCVIAGGVRDGEAALKCELDRFRLDDAQTDVSIVLQFARLKKSEVGCIQSTSAIKGTLESRRFQLPDCNWVAWIKRAFRSAGVIQSICGLCKSLEENSQLINWRKKQRSKQSESHVELPSKSSRGSCNNKARSMVKE